MKVLSFVGTAAMLWVGGGIIVHGLEHFHLDTVPHFITHLSDLAGHTPALGAVTSWLTFAAGSAVVGFIIGGVIVAIHHLVTRGKH
jgi:predicted DNA repair protein MutK